MAAAGASGFMAEVSQEWSEHSHAWDHSPRGGRARSQVSMAVSFEGASVPQGSAAVSSQAGGESALSAAEQHQDPEGAGEHSSQPSLPGLEEGQGQHHVVQGHVEQPANSLLSTAMQPSSPPIHRANSVVSHTAVHAATTRGPSGVRAGTPASVYGQARALPRPRLQSPQGSTAGQQHSSAGDEVRTSQRLSRRPSESSARALGECEREPSVVGEEPPRPQASLWQQAISGHVDGAISQQQAMLYSPLLNGMYGGHVVPNMSTDARTLSIEAMQQGGADDSQRVASAAQAGEEFEQHAISQPIAMVQHGAASNRTGPAYGGSGAGGPHMGGQHPLAVPHAGSFIAGPALPSPAQVLMHPQAALSASIVFPHLVSQIQQAWSQNGYSYGAHGPAAQPAHPPGVMQWPSYLPHQQRMGGLYGGAEAPLATSGNTHPVNMRLRFPHPPQRAAVRSEDGSHAAPALALNQGASLLSNHCQSSCHDQYGHALPADVQHNGPGGVSAHPVNDAPSVSTIPLPAHSQRGSPPGGPSMYGFGGAVDTQNTAQATLPASGGRFDSRGASPAVDQAAPHDLQQGPMEPAHAAASVHATVLSEEDVQSDLETDLSSMHGREGPSRVATSLLPSSRPARSPHSSISNSRAAGGSGLAAATGEETLGQRHRANSGSKEDVPCPVNSTDGMAGAPAPRSAQTWSGTVDMMQMGSQSGMSAPPASRSGSAMSMDEVVRQGSAEPPSGQQGATSAPGAMPAVTSPKHRGVARAARSPQLSGGPALAVELGANARNASVEAEENTPGHVVDGTPSDSRMGMQGDYVPPAPACETTLGMLQAPQPLSAITTAADHLPAGSLGSNGEAMEVDNALLQAGPIAPHQHPAEAIAAGPGLPPLPHQNGRQSVEASTAMGPPNRSRPTRHGIDKATSQPRPAPSPLASNASSGQGQRGVADAAALASPASDGPYQGDGGPQGAVTLSGAMPALTMVTNGAGAQTAPIYELESVPAPGALLPHPGPQPALTIVSGMVDSRRSSSRAAVSRSCDSARGLSNSVHTLNGRSTSNGHMSNGYVSGGSSAPVTSPSVTATRGRRESNKRKRTSTSNGRRTPVNGHH